MDSESESEPDSPRVSCVGQIEIARKVKEKKKKKTSKEKVKRKKMSDEEENPERRRWMWEKKKRKMKSAMEVEDVTENGAEAGMETTPYLGRMKRFASGRGSLSDFEWKMVGGEGEPSSSY